MIIRGNRKWTDATECPSYLIKLPLFHCLHDLEAFEVGPAEIEITVGAGSLVRLAEGLGPGPASKFAELHTVCEA